MSGRFKLYLDPSGLSLIWDNHLQEPATVNGKMLAFTTQLGAKTFTAVLNAREQARQDGRWPTRNIIPSQRRRVVRSV